MAYLAFILSCAALASSYAIAERLHALRAGWFTFLRFVSALLVALFERVVYALFRFGISLEFCDRCYQSRIVGDTVATTPAWNIVVIGASYALYTLSFAFLVQRCSYFAGSVAPLAVAQAASLLHFLYCNWLPKGTLLVSIIVSMVANTVGCYLLVTGGPEAQSCSDVVRWLLSTFSGYMWFTFLAIDRPHMEPEGDCTLFVLISATLSSLLIATSTSPFPDFSDLPVGDVVFLGLVPGFLGLRLMNFSLTRIHPLMATLGTSFELVFILLVRLSTSAAVIGWYTLVGLSLIVSAQIMPSFLQKDSESKIVFSPLVLSLSSCFAISGIYAISSLEAVSY